MTRPPLSAAERAQRAAASLSPIERAVLVLSSGRGLSNREIAARLGIRERRAERILARALYKFTRALEGGAHPWSRWRR